MRPQAFPIIAAVAIVFLVPSQLHAWCLMRDTDSTSTGCDSPTQYIQNCCSGNPRQWLSGSIPYYIASATPGSLVPDLIAGVSKWNDVEMSTFEFLYQGLSAQNAVAADGINLISIDTNFATNNDLLGQGVLAISTTWTQGDGTGAYRAVESDIAFNGEEFTWGDGTGGTIDTVGVSAHESGHSAGLSHAGGVCRDPGSEGCGAEVLAATMYWNYSAGQPTDKGSLELDDAAALIAMYPASTFRVKVDNPAGDPMPGVLVELLGAAAPLSGDTAAEGGQVWGDVTNSAVLMGDKASSFSYVDQTPFNLTDATGYTQFINPTHRSIQLRVTAAGVTTTSSHTVTDGTSTLIMVLTDALPPTVSALSPADGATNASTSTTVRATFNETIDTATLTPATFTNNRGLAGSISYDASSRTAIFTPASSLAYQTTYTFTLTTGIRDVSGNAMAAPVTWSFTTRGESSDDGSGCFIRAAGD